MVSRIISFFEEDRVESSQPNLTGSLLALFKRLIAEKTLRPGDRLPAERDLAETLQVSRSSLRQALKVMESIGVISQQVGSGTRLNPAAASILSEPLEFLILLDGISSRELMEARLIVEPQLAARAASRATPEDEHAMERAIARMEASDADADPFVASDLEFHRALFRAAGNRVCEMLFTVVHQSLEELVRFTSALVPPEHTIRFHRQILAAIRERDPKAAESRMREHLEDVCELLAREPATRAQTPADRWSDALRRLSRDEAG
jgi:GntR family transcriptional repressor for pyruvate dehydrogenase complex